MKNLKNFSKLLSSFILNLLKASNQKYQAGEDQKLRRLLDTDQYSWLEQNKKNFLAMPLYGLK